MSEGGVWYDVARLCKDGGFFKNPSNYQEYVMLGMYQFEEWQKKQETKSLIEHIFAIVRPEDFTRWDKKRSLIKEEEGVDEVVYSGEDDWADIDKELAEFGFSNVDPFGKGLEQFNGS